MKKQNDIIDLETVESPKINGAVNCITLSYQKQHEFPVGSITSPDDAQMFMRKIWNPMIALKESFYVLLLDNSKNIVGYYLSSMGGITATVVDVSDIFRVAVLSTCSSIIVAHNHPSGHMKPSIADISLTKRIVDAGKILGIPLDDHIILSPEENEYISFRQKCLL